MDPQWVHWVSCADEVISFPGQNGDWPVAGSGIAITWNECQAQEVAGEGIQAIIGAIYCYVYSEDVLRIIPNNHSENGPELAVTDCDGVKTNLLDLVPEKEQELLMARVHFGGDGSQGFNPCALVPVQKTSWGQMKAKYQTTSPRQ